MLDIRNFSKIYTGGKRAVDDLTLSVAPGDVYGFIGHNGAGKTTTIRAVVGVLDYEEGTILVEGHNVKDDPVATKSRIAYIPDKPDLYEYITGIQYLNYIADIYGVERDLRQARIEKYAGMFDMTSSLGDLISSYSHGMKQKCSLIAAFMHQPKLLILDEPFIGLDPVATVKLREMMHELCAGGSAIFFSSHILVVVEKLCNKIGIIKDGRLVTSGATETVLGDSSLEDIFLEVARDDS
ncbi:MAG: ABC transporter ATP-binding protein [Defluviitaleaceae bacterium]|nr:ABC transporter ATP-binding protein [Defluviitaleaceae bacterium]